MPEALISRITSRGPGIGSGNSLSSSLRSPRNTTPFMVLLRCASAYGARPRMYLDRRPCEPRGCNPRRLESYPSRGTQEIREMLRLGHDRLSGKIEPPQINP